jgi:hypothetical protein
VSEQFRESPPRRPLRILNLGAGEQSSAVFLLAATGEIGALDYAIFADTGEEPKWVYAQVEELRSFPGGCPILIRHRVDSTGAQVRLGDNCIGGNEGRFASIPAFLKHPNLFVRGGKNAQGKGKRQCTSEFKIEVVETCIRYELLGLKPRQAYKGERITRLFGLDFSEGQRIFDLKIRLASSPLAIGEFPLWDMQWKRSDCRAYIKEILGHEFKPSACTFCPLVNNAFRRMVRDEDPEGHERACMIDIGLRHSTSVSQKGLGSEIFVHRKMVPLGEVNLDEPDGLLSFAQDCEGFCGH